MEFFKTNNIIKVGKYYNNLSNYKITSEIISCHFYKYQFKQINVRKDIKFKSDFP